MNKQLILRLRGDIAVRLSEFCEKNKFLSQNSIIQIALDEFLKNNKKL